MTMIDEKAILSISEKGRLGHWPYPKIYRAYKDLGLEGYSVEVETHTVTFFCKDQIIKEVVNMGGEKLLIAPFHDKAKIEEAIEYNQTQGGSYPQFLKDIAAAGVMLYRVQMKDDTIHYLGMNGEDYVEGVPVNIYPFETSKVKHWVDESVKNEVNYPAVFEGLRQAGILFFTLDVAEQRGSYHGDVHIYESQLTESKNKISIAGSFSEEKLKQVLEKRARNLISFPQFLSGLGEAGVAHVKVDLLRGIQTFNGNNGCYKKMIPRK
ncbi:MAG: DUF1398 family protein [Parachlamydiales bacterium]